MKYFTILTWRAQVLFLSVLLSVETTPKIRRQLPDITNFIEKYVKPYIDPLKTVANSPVRRTTETQIERAILEKIAELEPFLQDNDNNKIVETLKEAKLDLEGDETTIIEFLPKTKTNNDFNKNREMEEIFKLNIHKYKKMREKIKDKLNKESVSDKTKDIIIKTLDEIIAQLIASQCTWKSVDNTLKIFRTNGSFFKNNNRNLTADWEEIKHIFSDTIKADHFKETLAFINQFHDFFTHIMEDTKSSSNKYKLKCQIVRVDSENKKSNAMRHGNKKQTEFTNEQCYDFKICAKELKEFMLDFYNALNDTAVSAFRNYAEMFLRDVNTEDSREKDTVVSVLTNISDKTERKVIKIFKKEISKLKLDKDKSRKANIKILSDFVENTVNHVKNSVEHRLETDLQILRARLLLSVKQDVDVNLKVDLGNLAREYTDQICTVFATCNSKYYTRRNMNSGYTKTRNGNRAYVKVQLTFDDDFEDNLGKSNRILRAKNKNIEQQKLGIENLKHMYSQINVTRTTLSRNDEVPASTKLKNSLGNITTGITIMYNNFVDVRGINNDV